MLNCLSPQSPGLVLSRESGISSLRIFPHYVLLGNSHLSSSAQTIRRAMFFLDDAISLFYDQRAFRYEVIQPSESDLGRITGHYTQKASIVSTSTDFGTISAYHNIDCNPLDIADGIRINNTVSVEIDFEGAVDFGEALSRVSRVISLLELMIGRPQNLVKMHMMAEAGDERESRFDVYWSMYPDYGRPDGNRKPFHLAVLIQAARQPDAFEKVLSRWIERDSTWRDARMRFSNNFAKELRYDDDRLTGAANMFDILPDASFSQNKGPSPELACSVGKCKAILRRLPNDEKRNEALNALGRINRISLKDKIRQRGDVVLRKIGEQLPDLGVVVAEAVNCRNHYVHGGPSRIDYRAHSGVTPFLTNTLEFVFAASDLVDAGWDIKRWCDTRGGQPHPFAAFLNNYADGLEDLRNAFRSSGRELVL